MSTELSDSNEILKFNTAKPDIYSQTSKSNHINTCHLILNDYTA